MRKPNRGKVLGGASRRVGLTINSVSRFKTSWTSLLDSFANDCSEIALTLISQVMSDEHGVDPTGKHHHDAGMAATVKQLQCGASF